MADLKTLIFSGNLNAYSGNDLLVFNDYEMYQQERNSVYRINPKLVNCIIETSFVLQPSDSVYLLAERLFPFVQILQDFVSLAKDAEHKCIIIVINQVDQRLQGFVISFFNTLLKSVQVENKYSFRFTILNKPGTINLKDRHFISRLLTEDLRWFVNNQIQLV